MTQTWVDNPTDEPATAGDALPIFSLAKASRHRTDAVAVDRYHGDRRLRARNIVAIGTATIGWNVALQIVTPLVATRLLDLGVRENIQGTIASINLWAVSFLVMLFGWMSDHTISRFGRRKPYLFIAAPFIIASIAIFPFVASPERVPLLLTLQVVYLLFMDLKNSTFALVMIDCVPRAMLARSLAVVSAVSGLTSFVANRYAAELLHHGDKLPLLLAAGVMLMTTITAGFVREPPVYHPRTAPFRPWSTFRTAAAFDKRIFVLMAGIALLFAFPSVCTQWLWFWSKESLGLTKAEIFQAVSWSGLVSAALAYPIGWFVDRFGGLRVVLVFQALCVACFVGMLHVSTKADLVWLVVAQTVTFPMYWSADMLVYKSCPPQNVGAITATNSCFRNAFLGCLSLLTGWVIYWANSDYRVGFAIGLGLTTVGCVLCVYHQKYLTGARLAGANEEQGDAVSPLVAPVAIRH